MPVDSVDEVIFEPHSINEKGQVAGKLHGRFGRHAALWDRGKMTDLGTLGGPDRRRGGVSEAFGVNNRGEVVGYTDVHLKRPTPTLRHPPFTERHAFVWTRSGGMRDLGVPTIRPSRNFQGSVKGTSDSNASGINDRGDVVGGGTTPHFLSQALLWRRGGRMIPLGEEIGRYGQRSASAVNEKGEIVGWIETAGGSRPFLWRNGRTTLLGGLVGSAQAKDINERGQVVGVSSLGRGGATHAFLWQDGRMHDLNQMIPSSAGWVLEEAVAINDRGQIVCNGYVRGDRNSNRALLLTPVKR
jgi:probable HAF family extracellular repeat protein